MMGLEVDEIMSGHKTITSLNLTVRDAPDMLFPGGAETWIEVFDRVKLSDRVPLKIVGLFDVAKGTMIYGWFYYPLLTVGTEQCFRIVESAVRIKCEEIGIETKRLSKKGEALPVSFSRLQEALFTCGILDYKERDRWDALRDLRNMASHPESQSIMTPAMAVDMLRISVGQVNELFK
jgi:hypothetical protein